MYYDKSLFRFLKSKTPFELWGDRVFFYCPFHHETRPSFNITFSLQVYHCFSCNRSGTLAKLYRELTGQSLENEDKKPIKINLNELTTYNHIKSLFKNDLINPIGLDINILNNLKKIPIRSSEECLEYLKIRGLNLEVVENMGGFYIEEDYVNGTLFKKRLVFPIIETINNEKRLLSLEGRDVTFKHPLKVIYPKGSSVSTLWNYDNLNKFETLYITEGLIDLIVLRELPQCQNSTCIFGASLSKRQIELLKQFLDIVIIPDSDKPGEEVVNTLRKCLNKNIRVVEVPKGYKDLGELAKHHRITDFTYWLRNL